MSLQYNLAKAESELVVMTLVMAVIIVILILNTHFEAYDKYINRLIN